MPDTSDIEAAVKDPSGITFAGGSHHLPLVRGAHGRCRRGYWELRDNLTVYDAAYVALAEALDAVSVTADVRLARAPGVRCDVEVLESG